jgi:hypothetical protein
MWRDAVGCVIRIVALTAFGTCCDAAGEGPGSAGAALPRRLEIAVLGDSSRISLMWTLARHYGVSPTRDSGVLTVEARDAGRTFRFSAAEGDDVRPHAALAARADLALLCIDGTVGPRPIAREHVLLSRQARVPEVVIAFTRSGQVKSGELLELEELEARELLKVYKLPGDNAACVFDDVSAPASGRSLTGKGPRGIVNVVAQLAHGRPPTEAAVPGLGFEAAVYALVPEESFRPDIAGAFKDGSATMLIDGRERQVAVSSAKTIAPGDNGTVQLVFAGQESIARGTRFVFVRAGHISAAGTIVSAKR